MTDQQRARLILVVGILAAWSAPFFMIVPHDFSDFLLPWYRHILVYGPIGAFAHPFSNYSPPYLYLLSAISLVGLPPFVAIKLLSVIGALWASYAVYRATDDVDAALAFFLLPTVLINVPILGQADMFWVAPALLAVTSKRTLETVTWAGLAFAFKAQAIFLAPFVIAWLVHRKAPWWHWTIPPLVYVVAMLPAWLAGWPVADLLTVYLRQAQYVPPGALKVVSTASNWWALFAYLDYDLALRSFWIGFALAGMGTVLYVYRVKLSDPLAAAFISASMIPFLLPGMHERFYVLAEVIAFCVAWKSGRWVVIAVLMQAQLLLAYFGWILQRPELPVIGAVLVGWTLLSESYGPDIIARPARSERVGDCRAEDAA